MLDITYDIILGQLQRVFVTRFFFPLHIVFAKTRNTMSSSSNYEDASDSDEDEEECRVCRGPAEPG